MTILDGTSQDRRAELREELAPLIGERVVALLESALDAGEADSASADVTEAEALLLEWASSRGALNEEASQRFERTFSAHLRSLLAEFVAASR